MTLLVFISLALLPLQLVSAGWTNTDFETTLQCTTEYTQGNASSVDTFWLITETQTTTESSWVTKTEVYTPKASTTTLSAVATSYVESLVDEWTSIITTATITSTVTLETVITATAAVTTTTTVAAEYPHSNRTKDCSPPATSTHVKDKNDWEVADVYWTTASDTESSPTHNASSPTGSGLVPVKVACTLTTHSNNFWTTTTVKQPGLTPTYTRTTLFTTQTSTLISRTKRLKFYDPPASTETWQWNAVIWATAYQTSTTTTTTTRTSHIPSTHNQPNTPHTTPAPPSPDPCAYADGIFNAHHRLPLASLSTGPLPATFYHYKYNNNGKSYQSGSDCCREAAREPSAVAWYQQPYVGCSIYTGSQCALTNSTTESTKKEKVVVYYDTTPGYGDTAYGSVGGGRCGDVDFVNLWA